MDRSITARKASTPKYWRETQSLAARHIRDSWMP
jgi:hypothetical protein